VSEQLLTILKFCLLALIYLFFFRVLRAVWAEVTPVKVPRPRDGRDGRPAPAPPQPRRAPKPQRLEAPAAPPKPARGSRPKNKQPTVLTVTDPPESRGRSYPLTGELKLGRAATCEITVDDTYVSQVHARVYGQDGNYLVEDLGSTNGTYLNQKKVSGAMTMQQGDRLQVGNTVLELE
jgi:pSer/pThr/pTyr-binding forkhead associated (FHA) protein